MSASVAATLLFVGSPLLVREFDVQDAPEAPPLAALASIVTTVSGGVTYDTMGDAEIDVWPLNIVVAPST